MGYQIKIPSCVYAGIGSIQNVKDIVKKESAKKALVFTDKGISGAGLTAKLLEVLDEAGVSYVVFDELRPEPAYTDVEKVVAQMDQENGDLIF
ncbi:MAG: iron-containing alcohol dehydrogenase, partial [Lachnospiraceae bacterium]|nr:iron-containing alcohol dehydrogenase [Lachnospiraceae bacterium]